VSIGNINTLFSLFHQEKKEIRESAQSWNTGVRLISAAKPNVASLSTGHSGRIPATRQANSFSATMTGVCRKLPINFQPHMTALVRLQTRQLSALS
jgi:hypothetical protein